MIFNRYMVVQQAPSGRQYFWSSHTFKFAADSAARDSVYYFSDGWQGRVLDRRVDDVSKVYLRD